MQAVVFHCVAWPWAFSVKWTLAYHVVFACPPSAQELAHESKPRWIIHGTPASGAGIMGLLHEHCTVVAHCKNEAHAKELKQQIIYRVAEEYVSPGAPLSIMGCP